MLIDLAQSQPMVAANYDFLVCPHLIRCFCVDGDEFWWIPRRQLREGTIPATQLRMKGVFETEDGKNIVCRFRTRGNNLYFVAVDMMLYSIDSYAARKDYFALHYTFGIQYKFIESVRAVRMIKEHGSKSMQVELDLRGLIAEGTDDGSTE